MKTGRREAGAGDRVRRCEAEAAVAKAGEGARAKGTWQVPESRPRFARSVRYL